MSFQDNLKNITPNLSQIKTGTPVIKVGNNYIVGGIGGDFIPGGSISSNDMDLSFITADGTHILSGYVGATVSGTQVIGTIPTVSAIQSGTTLTIPSGYIESSQTFQMGIDVSDTTALAQTTLQGTRFYNSSGVLTSGTIPWKGNDNVYVQDGMIIVQGGFYDQTLGKGIPEGSVTSNGNVITITNGYVSSSSVTVGTANSGGNIIPSTSSTVFNAGTYLTSSLTIQGDVNLIESNIVSGKTIFGVTGTAEVENSSVSNGETSYYKCVSYTPQIQAVEGSGYIVTGASPAILNGTYQLNSGQTTKWTNESGAFMRKYENWTPPVWDMWQGTGAMQPTWTARGTDPTEITVWEDTVGIRQTSEIVVTKDSTPGSPASWTGYQQIYSNGVYVYGSAVTSGLSISSDGFEPVSGATYSTDATMRSVTKQELNNMLPSYYKCTQLVSATSGGVIVESAGTAAVNGSYTLISSAVDSQRYTNASGNVLTGYASGGKFSWGFLDSYQQMEYYWGISLDADPSHVEVWNVQDGQSPAPVVSTVLPASDSWNGQLASVDSSGVWSFTSSITRGLSYDRLIPAVGKVYDEDCTMQITQYKTNNDGLVFHHSLRSATPFDDLGTTAMTYNNVTFTTIDGRYCMYRNGSAWAEGTPNNQYLYPYGTQPFTVMCWVYLYNAYNYKRGMCIYGTSESVCTGIDTFGSFRFSASSAYGSTEFYAVTGSLSINTWHHLAYTYDGNRTYRTYYNGALQETTTKSYDHPTPSGCNMTIGKHPSGVTNGTNYISDVRLYNRVLTQAEIQEIMAI